MENQSLHKKPKFGFAGMSPEKQREIASKGGKLAHEKRVAHEWNREEAKKAGKRGGEVSAKKRSLNRTENDGCDHLL